MYCEGGDLVTYLIVMCDDKTSIREAQRVTHLKVLHTTVTFILEVRGVNVAMRILKITKFRCGEYCTIYHSNPYVQPGIRVFVTE